MARVHPRPADTFLTGKELPEIQQLLGASVPAYRAKQVYEALYRHNITDLAEATALPDALRAEIEAKEGLGRLVIDNRFASSDGTIRYLLKLPLDGRTVETVLMPEETRYTICVSTQVGCPVDCKFCLTAAMGLERNLTAGEIVGQVLVLVREHQLDPQSDKLNLVFMGMGEPLLNLDNVLKAVRILCDRRGVAMAERRIAISTSGIIPKIEELGRAEVRPRLAISLNASSDEQRREIMPITRKYPLKDLIEACRVYPLRTREHLMFEYVLLGGVNDTPADARRVVKLLANLKAKVNLIALNPGPGIPFVTPEPEAVDAFQKIIMKALPCYVRKPRGRDIYAACGQLKRTVEDGLVTIPVT